VVGGCLALKPAPALNIFFLTDLCFDLFVHFLIYYKKQFRGIFVKKRDYGKKIIIKSLKW